VVGGLPSKHEALISNYSSAKKIRNLYHYFNQKKAKASEPRDRDLSKVGHFTDVRNILALPTVPPAFCCRWALFPH
jgi:hypothetical protein